MSKASVGVNEKDICYKKINEILNSVEIKFDDGVLKEAIQALDIFSRKDTPIVDKDTKLLEKYRSVLSSVLTNPKLLPQAKDIIEVFEQFTNGATKDRTASIKDLTDRVLTDKKIIIDVEKNQSLQNIISTFNGLASDPKIGEKIGESNAQEFKEQITKLQETFDKTPRNRDSVIQVGLSTLTQWCDIKQEKTQKGIWANIKSTVTAAVSTLGAIVSNDAEMYKQSILKLKQKASELTGHRKEFSKELENIKKVAKDYGISNLEGSLLKKNINSPIITPKKSIPMSQGRLK